MENNDYNKVFDKIMEFASSMSNEDLAIFQEILDTHDYSIYEAITKLLYERAPSYFGTSKHVTKKEL